MAYKTLWRHELMYIGAIALVAPPIGLLVLYVGWFLLWSEHYTLERVLETLGGIPIALLVAYPLGITPAVIGAVLIRVIQRHLPQSWRNGRISQFAWGAAVGIVLACPTVLAIYEPSQRTDPRVITLAVLVGFVTGGLCASLGARVPRQPQQGR